VAATAAAATAAAPRTSVAAASAAPGTVVAAAAPPGAVAAPSAGAAAGALAQEYALRLTRTPSPGDKRLAVGSAQTDDRVTGGPRAGTSEQRQVSTIRYVVATEILAVSAQGNARRAALTVRRLTKESGGVTVELAKPGALVEARLEGHDRVFELQGARLAPDLQQALAAAVALRADDEPNDDDLFGVPHPVQVGESWPVNAPLFARTGALSAAFDPKDVSGTVTLAAVKPAGGAPCLEVRWKLEARHGTFKPGSLPSGLMGVMTSTSVTGSTLLPNDAKLPPVSRETAIAGVGDFTGSSSDGSTYSVHHELRQVIHVDLSPLR
jgi:hypothetical protein